MYKLNDILLSTYGIIPGRIQGEGIAVKGIFDLPKRIGDIEHSWGDEDGVDPFVGVGEIFLGGRDIEFQGIIIGSESVIKTYLTAFKNDVSAFVNVVPFETPYGTVCVYVKKYDVKHYNGGSIITIQFREPIVGAVCGVNIPPSIYLSAAYSDVATRNNCDEGYHGTQVTLIAIAGQFTSTVNQAAANQLAVDWVLENIQDYANVNGTCEINPTVYYNVKLSGSLQKECDPGYEGSTVTYTVDAYKYQSLVSQAAVDAMAQAELDVNLTQAYANAQGVCKVIYLNQEVSGQVQKDDCASGYMGSVEVYTVPAGTHSSVLSQAHANALAQAAFNMDGQNYANQVGTCVVIHEPGFDIRNKAIVFPGQGINYTLRVAGTVIPGHRYVLNFRSTTNFQLHYTAQSGDSLGDVIFGLSNLITYTTPSEWSALAGRPIIDVPNVHSVSGADIRIICPSIGQLLLQSVWVSL